MGILSLAYSTEAAEDKKEAIAQLFRTLTKDDEANHQGTPSRYTIPFKGTNYLWDRKQQEALALLKRYDYEAVSRTSQSYWQRTDANEVNGQLILRVQSLVEAATTWLIFPVTTRYNNYWN